MGVGFTFALFLLGAVREVLGSGKLFGYEVLGGAYNDVLVMILPPGAFLATGVLLGLFNYIESKRRV
jgi:electron transport complex protein RnfE